MEAVAQEAMRKTQEFKRSSVPWQADEPTRQNTFTWDADGQRWTKTTTTSLSHCQTVSSIALFSWNVDFMLPFAESRMAAALDHLETQVSSLPAEMGVVIFLQECVASDVRQVGETAWVRDRFAVSDVDISNWQSGYYGTITLTSKNLTIKDSFRVHYAATRMERDAFFTDFAVYDDGDAAAVIRVCNTHLESLALEPPMRPRQLRLVGEYMRQALVVGAVVAGDFNAIQPFDRPLHRENGLRDAYLELGGEEDSEDGFTWGQQAATAQRQRFGCSRMDKVFYRGEALELQRFGRFGEDVEVSDEAEREQIINLGFDKPWITDHLGIMAVFQIKR